MPNSEHRFICPGDPIRVSDLGLLAAMGDPVALARIEKLHNQVFMRRVTALSKEIAEASCPVFWGVRRG
jgi:hypothetical protein